MKRVDDYEYRMWAEANPQREIKLLERWIEDHQDDIRDIMVDLICHSGDGCAQRDAGFLLVSKWLKHIEKLADRGEIDFEIPGPPHAATVEDEAMAGVEVRNG